jgi:WD40 repeat protein
VKTVSITKFLKGFWLIALFCLGILETRTFISAQDAEMPTIITDAKWQPLGEGLLVTGRGGPDVFGLWLFDTDMQLVRFFPTENLVSADWSPDGTRISMGRNILDSQTLEARLTIEANSGIGGWSPDGTQVLAWADEHHLGLYDSHTGALVRTIPVGEMIPDAVGWSPNGAYFALLQPIGRTDIISAEDGRQLATVPMEYPIGLRWSSDSRYLAAAFTTIVEPGTPNTLPDAASPTIASVVVWEALTGTITQSYNGLPAVPLRLRWHPHKPELAGAASEGLIFIWNTETGQEAQIYRTIAELTSLGYSPFGGRLIVGGWLERQSWYDTQSFPMARQVRWSQPVVANTLETIVLDSSIEQLQSIGRQCNVPINVLNRLNALDRVPEFVTEIRANNQIQRGCAAELLALAEALQTTP